ncbi:MAG: hypothetical protein CVU59_04805 [Deltaproteobacteria bacterium HGW-Deltaproteobacteria-17]|nr:MAG: hypothetical protein CVU59_04805 [Deltaproteobacteria bacterium HGW-Deltaproteobacteria-17]
MHILLLILQLQFSQLPPPAATETPPTTEAARPGADDPPVPAGRPGLLARNPTAATIGAYAFIPALATLLGMQMWEWGDTTHFKAGSDGWFQRHNTHGGADKMGHAWSFYMGSRLFTTYFDAVYPGDHRKAAFFGAGLSWFGSVAVEIGDGFASVYGFSYTDLIANTVGVALALAQELWPGVDDLFDFSVHVLYSPGFMSPANPNKFDFATDYSGQLITLSLRLGGLGLARRNPLRYLRLDLGYFTRCYEVNDGCSKESLGTDAYETRNLYVGVSFDLARMIRDHGEASSWLQYFGTFSRYYNFNGFFPMGLNIDLNHGNAVNFGTNTDSQIR